MSFFTACAWVFMTISILRIGAAFREIFKVIPDEPLTDAQNNKVAEIVFKATKWPITIIVLAVLWLVFGE